MQTPGSGVHRAKQGKGPPSEGEDGGGMDSYRRCSSNHCRKYWLQARQHADTRPEQEEERVGRGERGQEEEGEVLDPAAAGNQGRAAWCWGAFPVIVPEFRKVVDTIPSLNHDNFNLRKTWKPAWKMAAWVLYLKYQMDIYIPFHSLSLSMQYDDEEDEERQWSFSAPANGAKGEDDEEDRDEEDENHHRHKHGHAHGEGDMDEDDDEVEDEEEMEEGYEYEQGEETEVSSGML